jgi:hypothetical protein
LAKDGGVFVAGDPNSVFMISKDNNVGLGTKRVESFIILDSKDAHGRIAGGAPFSSYARYSPRVIFFVSVKVLDATFLLKAALKPNVSVWVSVGQSFEKRRWAISMKINGTDKRATGSKIVGVEDD